MSTAAPAPIPREKPRARPGSIGAQGVCEVCARYAPGVRRRVCEACVWRPILDIQSRNRDFMIKCMPQLLRHSKGGSQKTGDLRDQRGGYEWTRLCTNARKGAQFRSGRAKATSSNTPRVPQNYVIFFLPKTYKNFQKVPSTLKILQKLSKSCPWATF